MYKHVSSISFPQDTAKKDTICNFLFQTVNILRKAAKTRWNQKKNSIKVLNKCLFLKYYSYLRAINKHLLIHIILFLEQF